MRTALRVSSARPPSVADAVLRGARQAPHAPPDDDDRQDGQRHTTRHQAGQPRVGDDQQDQAADHQQEVAQRLRHAGADDRLDDAVSVVSRDSTSPVRVSLEEAGRQAG